MGREVNHEPTTKNEESGKGQEGNRRHIKEKGPSSELLAPSLAVAAGFVNEKPTRGWSTGADLYFVQDARRLLASFMPLDEIESRALACGWGSGQGALGRRRGTHAYVEEDISQRRGDGEASQRCSVVLQCVQPVWQLVVVDARRVAPAAEEMQSSAEPVNK